MELWDTLSGPICTLWESQQKRNRDRKVQEIMSKIKTKPRILYLAKLSFKNEGKIKQINKTLGGLSLSNFTRNAQGSPSS